MAFQMDVLLRATIRIGATDLHIVVGKPPTFRRHGEFVKAETAHACSDADTVSALKAIAPEWAEIQVMEKGSADFAVDFEGARFRVNAYRDLRGMGLAIRLLPEALLTFDQVGMPKAILDLIRRPRGLFPITGPTGSGKTTTLACLVKMIAEQGSRHVITIEQPIEYRFEHLQGIVTQREVGIHTASFASGLREALRQDPDVIMVGELRDLETIEVALRAAETGHLVLGTLHTLSAAKTVDRLIEVFPEAKQAQIRTQLSTSLVAVMCQQLLRRKEGQGRVAAIEYLAVRPGISNLIRENKTYQIEGAMQTGKAFGMQLLDDHLYRLVTEGAVDANEAINCANEPDGLRKKLGQ